jgi:type I site-specific restriction-modification system R (restriction) subunit
MQADGFMKPRKRQSIRRKSLKCRSRKVSSKNRDDEALVVVDKLLTGFDAPPATISTSTNKCADHGCFRRFAG